MFKYVAYYEHRFNWCSLTGNHRIVWGAILKLLSQPSTSLNAAAYFQQWYSSNLGGTRCRFQYSWSTLRWSRIACARWLCMVTPSACSLRLCRGELHCVRPQHDDLVLVLSLQSKDTRKSSLGPPSPSKIIQSLVLHISHNPDQFGTRRKSSTITYELTRVLSFLL